MVGLLAADNTPLGRAVVHSEFRNVKDCSTACRVELVLAASRRLAPTGVEPISIVIPADEPTDSLSIVGLRLTEARIDGSDQFVASGRPIAIISNAGVDTGRHLRRAHPPGGAKHTDRQ